MVGSAASAGALFSSHARVLPFTKVCLKVRGNIRVGLELRVRRQRALEATKLSSVRSSRRARPEKGFRKAGSRRAKCQEQQSSNSNVACARKRVKWLINIQNTGALRFKCAPCYRARPRVREEYSG